MTLKSMLGDEYVECKLSPELLVDDPPCSLNTTLYLISCMQYLICCLCFSISKPFRKGIQTNPLYLISVIIILSYQSYCIIYLDTFTKNVFALVNLPISYRYFIAGMVVLNAILTYVLEKYFILWFGKFWISRGQQKKKEARDELVKKLMTDK